MEAEPGPAVGRYPFGPVSIKVSDDRHQPKVQRGDGNEADFSRPFDGLQGPGAQKLDINAVAHDLDLAPSMVVVADGPSLRAPVLIDDPAAKILGDGPPLKVAQALARTFAEAQESRQSLKSRLVEHPYMATDHARLRVQPPNPPSHGILI